MNKDVRDRKLPPAFFVGNRKKLTDALPDRSLAVLFSGSPKHLSEDVDYRFFANRNFYYLSGIEQESVVLAILTQNGRSQSILFMEPRNPERVKWVGEKLSAEDASQLSGIRDIRDLSSFEDFYRDLLRDSQMHFVYDADNREPETRQFGKKLLSQFDEKNIISLTPILTRFRMIKDSCEMDAIREAIHLTEKVLAEVASAAAPGVSELELDALFHYLMHRNGCMHMAFPPIIATGAHTLCLHHNAPSGVLRSGDLLQFDVGGRVAGLCADISRSIPVDRDFTREQSLLYQIMLQCQDLAFTLIKPGIRIASVNQAAAQRAHELLDASGLISGRVEDISRYYWHNISHHMGHDVHDVCLREADMAEGMVVTVEPGLYIPELGFGIRIEDDVAVTARGCEVLSACVPRQSEAVLARIGRR